MGIHEKNERDDWKGLSEALLERDEALSNLHSQRVTNRGLVAELDEARGLCRSWWSYVKLCCAGDFELWANTFAPDASEIEEEYPWLTVQKQREGGGGAMSRIKQAVEAENYWAEKLPSGYTRRGIRVGVKCEEKHLAALQSSLDSGHSLLSAEVDERQELAGYPFAEGWRTLSHCQHGFGFLVQVEDEATAAGACEQRGKVKWDDHA